MSGPRNVNGKTEIVTIYWSVNDSREFDHADPKSYYLFNILLFPARTCVRALLNQMRASCSITCMHMRAHARTLLNHMHAHARTCAHVT